MFLILDKNKKTRAQILQAEKNSALASGWINAIYPDINGDKWVGTLRGTCKIEKDSWKVVDFIGDTLLSKLSRIPCASLWRDAIGRMWIGTTKGAWCFDEKKNKR